MKTTTRTFTVSATLARDNGHDITDGALAAAIADGDIGGLEIEADNLTVHDISEPTVRRHQWKHLIVVEYVIAVESALTAISTEEALFDAATFNPSEGWETVSTFVSIGA
jgi:hypothetical protein